ncbi:hypothetical protein PPTG_12739 [Phytophthora nicotianae INRA-310]|uniref:Core-binding (CB) domain-containing protein n=1 Tax=Phytophthora nicotianae (strain INRA-310) TaxID=761204 RepID=W2Q336_PHYN3|nr:hypothetical protein PPTG_12739 [Phytophthora nicotianae INRA-310]ETN06690.1 hypothetical protein PPTG_12739 [Phytophthora nicotianae INRA-310]
MMRISWRAFATIQRRTLFAENKMTKANLVSSVAKSASLRSASPANPQPPKQSKGTVPAIHAVVETEAEAIEEPLIQASAPSSSSDTPPASIHEPTLIDEEVTAQDVREACVAKRTQLAYAVSLRVISRWIGSTKKNDSSNYFDGAGQIDLRRFTAADFEAFLLEKRKKVGVSTLNGFRSAIKDLYR